MTNMGQVLLYQVCFSLLLLSAQPAKSQEDRDMSIDEIIVNAANSSEEFEFFDKSNQHVRIEYDMVFRVEDLVGNSSDPSGKKRSVGIHNGAEGGYRWLKNTVYYQFAPGTFSGQDRAQIRAAMYDWRRYTCLSFRHAKWGNRIYFDNDGGCNSAVGMQGGLQRIGLAKKCRNKKVVMHEIGHAIGLHHEQTRPDRDNYVNIVQRNVPAHLSHNFKQYTWREVINLGIPYDYRSIMHYSSTAFGGGKMTIETKDPHYRHIIGRSRLLSFRDIKTVNSMYKCSKRCPLTDSDCPGEGFVGKDCKCWCPGSPYVTCEPTTGGGKGKTKTTEKPIVTERPDPVTPRPTTPTTTTTTTTTTSATVCVDLRNSCPSWEKYCDSINFRTFLTTNCPKTCGVCSACVDKNQHCAFLAKQNECTRSPKFMMSNCKKSCGSCDLEEKVKKNKKCQDISARCEAWKRYCRKDSFLTFMKTNCAKTCQFCTITSSCTDKSQYCVSWAKKGDCSRFSFVRKSCKKSCGVCGRQQSESEADSCYDNNRYCSYLAKNGQCSSNQHVKNYCKQSCGTCGVESKGSSSCVDASHYCSYWARIGDCNTSVYMATHCKKSCGMCSTDSTKCVDENQNCVDWGKNNECTRNPQFMLKSCKKSCRVCEDREADTSCQDQNYNCADWSKKGECTSNPAFMLEKCRKSCGQCGDSDGTSGGQGGGSRGHTKNEGCTDQSRNCASWVKSGECTKSSEYMLTYCKKACGACSARNSDNCADQNANCVDWAKNSECTRNPGYMLTFCKKSCDACD